MPGVAWLSNIIHIKVFPDGGGGATFADIDQALDWCIANVEAYNITSGNLSIGAGNELDYVQGHGFANEYQALADKNVLTVVAAVNSGQYGVNYLAADPNAIAVSASTANNTKVNFTQHYEELTDVFAFGDRVSIEDEAGQFHTVSGISFSAPYVAATAAHLQEAADEILNHRLSQDEFVYILQESGEDLIGYEGDAAGYKVANVDLAVQYFIDNVDHFSAHNYDFV